MTTARRSSRSALLALVLAALLALAPACGDDDDGGGTADTGAADGGSPAALSVAGAWARTSPAVADAGAVYFTITNGTDADDTLVGASVDATVAAKAELHETVQARVQGSATTGGMAGGTAPMMEMRAVESIAVPAGETVTLEPGGYHVMLLELAKPLVAGATVELTLTFDKAGERTVVADVRDVAP